jgi:hypothetical protein
MADKRPLTPWNVLDPRRNATTKPIVAIWLVVSMDFPPAGRPP